MHRFEQAGIALLIGLLVALPTAIHGWPVATIVRGIALPAVVFTAPITNPTK